VTRGQQAVCSPCIHPPAAILARVPRFQFLAPVAIALAVGTPGLARAQAEAAPPVPSPPVHTLLDALKAEAKRYAADSAAFYTAPRRWSAADWKMAGGVTIILGGLFALDRKIDHAAQSNRSGLTNSVSGATTTFGAAGAFEISGALLAGGLVFQDANTRDMGREAIEASVITGLLTNLVLKPAFGRERPNVSNGRTDFQPASRNKSFPSGHATEAFSVASVVAMRSQGWVVPALAYTAATLVAFDRVNDRAHFSSDVFAGAILGTVTGRFLVSRHRREEEGTPSRVSFEIRPIRSGLSAHVAF